LDPQRTVKFDEDNKLNDLVQCCEMNSTCKETMVAAKKCATPPSDPSDDSCIPSCIKRTAANYLGCLQTKARDDVCKFAGFGCVGQLVGDEKYDFNAVLADAKQVTPTDCSPLDGFVNGVCDVSQRCCSQCNAQMGLLANCLVNRFILPLNTVSNGGTTCEVLSQGNAQCSLGDPVTAVGRSADNVSDATYDLEGVEIDDCSEDLSMNFVVHNETYAVDQFMECIGKKMGEIIALEEQQQGQDNADGASSANIVFGTFSLAVSTMLVAAMAM
jgi:hypothetical protein